MSNKKAVKKVKKKNPNLRLVKNNDIKPENSRNRQKETLRFGKVKRTIILSVLLFTLMILMISAYFYIVKNYTVTTVHVEGNIHYTNEEIMDMVMGGAYGNNSLILSLKYRDKGIEDIPFIQRMDVAIDRKSVV